MATFLKEFVISIDERWEEIDLLITKAKEVQDSDEKLYHVLCRSVTVLLVAHLEGFVKDLVRYVIRDLNRNCHFSSLPQAVKRTYCKKYLGTNQDGKIKSYENNLNKLIGKFDEIECQISDEPFFFSNNRNPNANVIKIIFNNFGISNVFDYLNKSNLEEMFSWSCSEIQTKTQELRVHIIEGLEEFPYSVRSEEFGLQKNKTNTKTLWEEFLEQINQKRHSVAHGNVFDNSSDVNELEKIKLKIILTQYAFITILASMIALKVSGANDEQPIN